MKIELPIEIGDPVIWVHYEQYDGWIYDYKGFDYSDIPELGKSIFKTKQEADNIISKECKK